MARWTFTDSSVGETYAMDVNPNAGGTMSVQKTVSYMTPPGPNSTQIMFEGRDEPGESQISGTFYFEKDAIALENWYNKQVQIKVTDDLGRETWVRINKMIFKRAPTRQHPWRHEFDIDVSELDWQ